MLKTRFFRNKLYLCIRVLLNSISMKKLILLFVLGAVVISCNNSPDSKANALIKEELKKSLYKPDTYQPVETVVDSAFSPQDDPELYKKMTKLNDFAREVESLELTMKNAKSSMALWSTPYQSSYGRNNYNEAKEQYEEANEKIEKIKEKAQPLVLEIAELMNKNPKFIGFKATHNYRADNNAGNTLIGNSVYIIDTKFEKILFSMEKEEYDDYQEALIQLKEQMEELQE